MMENISPSLQEIAVSNLGTELLNKVENLEGLYLELLVWKDEKHRSLDDIINEYLPNDTIFDEFITKIENWSELKRIKGEAIYYFQKSRLTLNRLDHNKKAV